MKEIVKEQKLIYLGKRPQKKTITLTSFGSPIRGYHRGIDYDVLTFQTEKNEIIDVLAKKQYWVSYWYAPLNIYYHNDLHKNLLLRETHSLLIHTKEKTRLWGLFKTTTHYLCPRIVREREYHVDVAYIKDSYKFKTLTKIKEREIQNLKNKIKEAEKRGYFKGLTPKQHEMFIGSL